MKSKGMQLGALLAAMLLLSMAFVPAVSAQVEKAQIEKQLKDTKIDWITNKEDKKEYNATVPVEGKEQKFFVKQWQEVVDGKKVWKSNIFEISPDGVISSTSLTHDTYYWTDGSGFHIHFGPIDTGQLKEYSAVVIAILVAGIIWACPPCAAAAGFFGAVLGGVIVVVINTEMNRDGSLDVFISWGNLALIPVYYIYPGNQNVYVQIGSHNYPVPI
jgi:hypothetical protein